MPQTCNLVEVTTDRGHKLLTCTVHNPENWFFRYVGTDALRCTDGPSPTDDMILSMLSTNKPLHVYTMIRRVYPTQVGAAPASKGAHMGASFRAAALTKRLKKLEAAGKVKFDGGDIFSLLMQKWRLKA